MAENDTILLFAILLVLLSSIHPPKPKQVLPPKPKQVLPIQLDIGQFLLQHFIPFFILLSWKNKVKKKCNGLNLIKGYFMMLLRVMCNIVRLKCLIRNIYNSIG
jgi:hypothetical protein